jgi:hypothetical protein
VRGDGDLPHPVVALVDHDLDLRAYPDVRLHADGGVVLLEVERVGAAVVGLDLDLAAGLVLGGEAERGVSFGSWRSSSGS